VTAGSEPIAAGRDTDDAVGRPLAEASLDELECITVGIDVGSSTTHLGMSRLRLRRLSDKLSTRMVVVARDEIHRSAITLTPYLPDYTIDAKAIARLVRGEFAAAGLAPDDIDTGAVILTGEAVKRHNAKAISAELAALAGSFVAATAGAHLEATIAAHGSGAVALSRGAPDEVVLNIDIGGGTTKFAAIMNGRVVRTGALTAGGRLVAFSAGGELTRIEPAAQWFAARTGVDLALGGTLDAGQRSRLAEAMADAIIGAVDPAATELAIDALWVTDPFEATGRPDRIVFSGGVAGFLAEEVGDDFGDLGAELGAALRKRLVSLDWQSRVAPARETIRATVIGASQYTVQATGATVTVTDEGLLPLRNVHVVDPQISFPVSSASAVRDRIEAAIRSRDELEPTDPVALVVRWRGVPLHGALTALAQGIQQGIAGSRPLVLVFDADVGRSLGEVLVREVGFAAPLFSLDGIDVRDLDFIDIGPRSPTTGSHLVVVKSLVFPAATPPV
jgi:ethanolamine utilization protein EutA